VTPQSLDDARCDLPLGVHAVAAARQFTEATLLTWDTDEDTRASAQLLASELVTNAVLYGFGARELRLQSTGTELTIMVADDAPGRPRARRPSDHSEFGRGMQVIEAYASRWGVEPDGDGKIVWCQLPLHLADTDD
jgi:two-component sensor histidine kinase